MLKTVMEKILVIGNGMTGASVTAMIRQDLRNSVSISVWDKSNGTGGRMATSRCNKDGRCTVDLGAQYISATPDYQQKHSKQYSELVNAGVLQQIDITQIVGHTDKQQEMKHYVVPNGVSALVKYYIQQADPVVKKGCLVTDISMTTDKVNVKTSESEGEEFDAVVITMPVPQILQLKGDIAKLIDAKGIRRALEKVSYSARFAVGVYYPPKTVIDVPWSAKYITDNPCIRYVAIDNKKRGKVSEDVGPSICVHTSAVWGMDNIERDKDEVAADILKQLDSVLPGLPQPTELKGHKWRYSQVHKAYDGEPGCVVLSENPAIILAGDAFTHSNFDGCVESATAVHKTLLQSSKSKV